MRRSRERAAPEGHGRRASPGASRTTEAIREFVIEADGPPGPSRRDPGSRPPHQERDCEWGDPESSRRRTEARPHAGETLSDPGADESRARDSGGDPVSRGNQWARASEGALSLIHISEPTRLGMISYA